MVLLLLAGCASIDLAGGSAGGDIDQATAVRGMSHSCAAPGDGTILCWGRNDGGQVAVGAGDSVLSPVEAPTGALGLHAPVAGWTATCASDDADRIWCWGDREGIPRLAARGAPLHDVAGGEFFCGRTASGSIWCWDLETLDGAEIPSSAGIGMFAVATNGCGIAADSLVQCWGYGGSPVALPGGVKFKSISLGRFHACGIAIDGEVMCWGSNQYYQLGRTDVEGSATPLQAKHPLSGAVITGVSAGGTHSCGRTAAGAVYCWGRAGEGALGIAYFAGIENVKYAEPVLITASPTAAAVPITGDGYTCVVSTAPLVSCWGRNLAGELGLGVSDTKWAPVEMPVAGTVEAR